MSKTVAILLPALNEAQTLPPLLTKLPLSDLKAQGFSAQVVVVDGHSIDNTLKIARKFGAVILLQPNTGKGDAIRYAFKALKVDYTFMLDADNTYPPQHILPMLDILEGGDYDIIMGTRLGGTIEDGAMTKLNFVGNKFLTWIANRKFGHINKITDLCTGFWGFNDYSIQTFRQFLTADSFDIEAEMYAKACLHGLSICEIPIRYGRRETPSKLGSIKDGYKIFKRISTEG